MLRRKGLGGGEMLLRMAENGAGSSGGASGGASGSSPSGEGAGQQPAGAGTGARGDGGAAGAGAGDGMSLDQALAELEKVRRALKDVNAESAGRRKRLEELETAEQARQQAAMSDAEKAQAAAKALEQKLADMESQQAAAREQFVRYEVMLKAQAMGIIDLDAAAKLMDATALEFGEDGKPTNVEAVLRQLVKDKPYLLKQAESGQRAVGTPPQKVRSGTAGGPGTNGTPAVRRVTPL